MTKMKKYEIPKISFGIFRAFAGTVKSLIFMWAPFMLRHPQSIRFLPQWIISQRPGTASHEEGIPSIPLEAISWMESFLKKDMKVFEWGSGGSTIFIAQRVRELVSIEHDVKWYDIVSQLIKRYEISNCKLLLKNPQFINNQLGRNEVKFLPDYLACEKGGQGFYFETYCRAIESYPNEYFDLVFIDGMARQSCITHALKKIKPEGFLMLDDTYKKEYASVEQLLKRWKRKDFFGFKPGNRNRVYQTTIWQKFL